MITTGFYRVAFHRKKLHAKAAFICNYPQCVCTYVLNFFQKPSVVIVPTSQCVYCLMGGRFFRIIYSEVPNRRADRNKRAGLETNATLLAFLLNRSINEQGGIFRLLLT